MQMAHVGEWSVVDAAGAAVAGSGGRIHAVADDALGELDAVAMAQAVTRGSVHPDELVAAAQVRAGRVADHLGAIVYQAPEARRTPAPGGELDAVPIYVKDNVDVASMPTSHGTAALAARPAEGDGRVTRQLLATGMALLGKSRMPEFGLNGTTEFVEAAPTRNPWDPARSVGGSSGGAAALVAAGVVPLGHGNDGGGSIRIPAAAAGLVGLKPTRGRLMDDELSSRMPVRLVCQGALSRSVRDTAAFLHAMERTWRNPMLPPVGRVTGPSSRRLRIGLLDATLGPGGLDASVRQAQEGTARLLESLGHRVEPVPLPVDRRFAVDFLHHWGLLALMIAVGGRRVLDRSFDPGRLDPLTIGLHRHARRHLPEMPAVIHRLRRAGRGSAVLFGDHDVVLSPVVSRRTPELGHLSPQLGFDALIGRLVRHLGATPLHNVAGVPSIAVPGPLDEAGLPTSSLLSATWGDERTLLELAYELEQARPFPRIQDPVTPVGG